MIMYKLKGYSYITIVEIPRAEIQIFDIVTCANPRETLGNFYSRQSVKPDFLMNAGFFNMSNGDPTFTFIDEGITLAREDWVSTGIGIVNNELKYGNINDYQWKDFVSGFPCLIADYKPLDISGAQVLNYKTRRSALGFNDTTLFLITVDTPGAKFEQLQDIFKQIGAKYAINLDGGGSTKLLYQGKSVTSTSYNRPVDNVISIKLKQASAPSALYRVQLGAFKSKANAEAFCKIIQQVPNYSSAYVRLVNGLYKVQVGAFSIKQNAQNMVNDLKLHGYNAFITQ